MNDKMELFKNDIKNKKIAVIGLGISNKALIKYLHYLMTKKHHFVHKAAMIQVLC